MSKHSRVLIAGGIILSALALPSPADVPIYAQRLQSGLGKPIFVASPPGDAGHLFIVQQGSGGSAQVRILDLASNNINPTPFITFSGLATGGEQGLLGMAFDPNYAANGRFYVNYTVPGGVFGQGISKIVRYTTADGITANPSTAQAILQFDQPQANHNGGWMAFGPDHYLYIATGDGGYGNDEDPPDAPMVGHTPNMGNAQDLTKLLGKMLRIDPAGDDYPADAARNYAIPKGGAGQPPKNPFYNDPAHPAARPEIWHYGLRNPWRDSFDRKTGDLYIGDVGQGQREEVDFQPAGSTGGINFGWRIKEGSVNGPGINDPDHAPLDTLTPPIFEYNHGSDAGIAVTGGYVYRGGENPALDGTYFFGDYGRAKIWTLKYDGAGPAAATLIQNPPGGLRITTDSGNIDLISSFGEDAQGNLYITELGTGASNGELFRLVPALPGDANGDWIVDIGDLKAFLDHYAPNVLGKTWADGDFNDDGIVDFRDFQILEQNFGRSYPFAAAPAGASVPEPAALAGTLAVLILLKRRRFPLSTQRGA